MTRYLLVLAAALLLLVGLARAESEEKVKDSKEEEHYPLAWVNIDVKPIIDNDRLFKKYKECLLTDNPKGCLRDVMNLKKLIPEVLKTECAKCLPEHVAKVKETVEYICKKRKSDYDEVLNMRDPSGATKAKFEAKFGTVDC